MFGKLSFKRWKGWGCCEGGMLGGVLSGVLSGILGGVLSGVLSRTESVY